MFARLSNLLLVLFMMAAVSALMPRVPNSNPVDPAIAARQATRTEISRQQLARRARLEMKASRANRPDIVARTPPRSSSAPYPKCPEYKGLGYANYRGWDYYANDLPYNPRYAEPNNEESCIAFCAAHKVLQPHAEVGKRTQNPDSNCIGVVYIQNGACYLKGERYEYGIFQQSGEYMSVDLVGGCAAWKDTVPAAMDAVCCDL